MIGFGTGRLVRRFAGDRRGNFGLAIAGVSAILLGAVGYSVNIAQMTNAKSVLAQALDAAVTSTARDLTTGTISTKDAPKVVAGFLAANSQTGFLKGTNVVLSDLKVDSTARTVEASASVDLPLAFPLFGGSGTRHISVSSASLYSDRKIEVAMILDVTGSMEGAKLTALKQAASDAVDRILANQNRAGNRIRIALVPYSNSVNVGPLAASSVFVEQKAADRKQAPASTAPILASASARPDNCATERKGSYAFSDAGPDVSMVNRDYQLSTFATKASTITCPDAAMMPLTADGAALKKRIDSFEAKGGTAGQIGVQWGWYMLSPSWKSVLTSAQQPGAYDARKTGKIAILMTDGAFNLEYAGAKTVASDKVYGEVYGDGAPKTRSIARAKDLCSQMKRAGIEIFTVGFQLAKEGPDATKLMADCATPQTGSTKYFYQAATGEDLNAAFQAIAGNIERLALTK